MPPSEPRSIIPPVCVHKNGWVRALPGIQLNPTTCCRCRSPPRQQRRCHRECRGRPSRRPASTRMRGNSRPLDLSRQPPGHWRSLRGRSCSRWSACDIDHPAGLRPRERMRGASRCIGCANDLTVGIHPDGVTAGAAEGSEIGRRERRGCRACATVSATTTTASSVSRSTSRPACRPVCGRMRSEVPVSRGLPLTHDRLMSMVIASPLVTIGVHLPPPPSSRSSATRGTTGQTTVLRCDQSHNEQHRGGQVPRLAIPRPTAAKRRGPRRTRERSVGPQGLLSNPPLPGSTRSTAPLPQRTGELCDQLEGPRNEIFEACCGRGGPGGGELIGR